MNELTATGIEIEAHMLCRHRSVYTGGECHTRRAMTLPGHVAPVEYIEAETGWRMVGGAWYCPSHPEGPDDPLLPNTAAFLGIDPDDPAEGWRIRSNT